MKRILFFFITMFFCLNAFNISAFALENIDLTSEAAILIDADTGQILYEKNSQQILAPASITKILTSIIVIEKCNLQDKVIVGKNPPFVGGSKIYIHEGEEFTVEQLLYALMLASANDVAEALAEHISGSVEEFTKLMNEYAYKIGCKNTYFSNPHGLYDENHYTTAYDMALIAKYAMKNEVFKTIVSTRQYIIPPTNKQPETRYINNHNKLLWNGGKYYYQYATGIKTGYTIKAKNTFVGSATKDGINLIVVVMKSPSPVYNDVIKLFEYGFNNYSKEKLIDSTVPYTYLKLNEGKTLIPVAANRDFYFMKNINDNKIPAQNVILKQNIKSIHKNEVVGKIELLIDGKVIDSIDLISLQDYLVFNNMSLNKINYKMYIYPLVAVFLLRGFYRKYKRKKGLI